MKKTLLITIFCITSVVAMCQRIPGPVESKITNAICDCITALDFSSLTDKQKANNAFMDCFSKQSSLLVDVAAERKLPILAT